MKKSRKNGKGEKNNNESAPSKKSAKTRTEGRCNFFKKSNKDEKEQN